jgi:hypothetical protein
MGIEVCEIWGQDSDVKGLRLIRFERIDDRFMKWLGEFDGPDADTQFIYTQEELEINKWKFVWFGYE